MPPTWRGAPRDFGVSAGPVGVDFAAVKARKDKVVGDSRSGISKPGCKGMANCTLIEGQARFLSPTTLTVGDDTLEAERIFINVGGRAVVPDFPGRDQVRTLTNTTAARTRRPAPRLVIVGGSYVGLEFAQIFRRFGSAVTVVEKVPRLIPREDEEVSDAIREILEAEGIAIRLDAECIRFAKRDAGYRGRRQLRVGRARSPRLARAARRRPPAEYRRPRARGGRRRRRRARLHRRRR